MDEVKRAGEAVPGANVVRVSLPAEMSYDLKRFQRVQAAVLERLGCSACCSGWDIRWDVHRNFLVDREMNLRELG